MSTTSSTLPSRPAWADASLPGMLALAAAVLGAGLFFWPGTSALLEAWQLPEYSHGPLIPVLSGLLFLRQLKEWPPEPGPKPDRWPGVAMIVFAVAMGALGRLSNIDDIVAYALIVFVGGLLLVSFGWRTGRHFWPPVLHLVYMLPLPGVIYYKMTTTLQFVSSELGVWMLKLISVPVFLDGNIIDLGVTKLHVAEACSGLRYLFPILSFSYIFAVLYRGPTWHKAVLLLSAVPITVAMNSVRIAIAGYIANRWGLSWLEGFTHFFEGWVIFIACIGILFAIAGPARAPQPRAPRPRGRARPRDRGAGAAGDAARAGAALGGADRLGGDPARGGPRSSPPSPERGGGTVPRDGFALFPRELGDWRQDGPRQMLDTRVEGVLGADDYHQVTLRRADTEASVGLFMAWYDDQSKGGGALARDLPAGRGMGDRLARADRHLRPDGPRGGRRPPLRHQPRDHPEGRDPDDGLLLVPAEGPPHRLGLRGQVLADDGRDHHRADRRRAGAADHRDRPRRERRGPPRRACSTSWATSRIPCRASSPRAERGPPRAVPTTMDGRADRLGTAPTRYG